jgi:hypothetical protein
MVDFCEIILSWEAGPRRMPMTLELDFPGFREGDWSVPDAFESYLGQSDGAWEMYSVGGPGHYALHILEASKPNPISFIWRSWPKSLASLELDGYHRIASGGSGRGFVSWRGAEMSWHVNFMRAFHDGIPGWP